MLVLFFPHGHDNGRSRLLRSLMKIRQNHAAFDRYSNIWKIFYLVPHCRPYPVSIRLFSSSSFSVLLLLRLLIDCWLEHWLLLLQWLLCVACWTTCSFVIFCLIVSIKNRRDQAMVGVWTHGTGSNGIRNLPSDKMKTDHFVAQPKQSLRAL